MGRLYSWGRDNNPKLLYLYFALFAAPMWTGKRVQSRGVSDNGETCHLPISRAIRRWFLDM